MLLTKVKRLSTSKGFTLIELLIVIAVLGVLAAIVLVALNPVEQLKRGRDAGRIGGVEQLGKAWTSYYTASQLTSFPAAAAGWQGNTLKTAGEIQNVLVAASPQVACGAAANQDSGYCYAQLSGGADYTVWVILESTNEANKAGTCANSTAAVYFYSKSKVQLDCLATASTIPAAADTLYNP